MSNDNNPIYSGTISAAMNNLTPTATNTFSAFSDEMIEFVDQNNNLYPPSFLSTETDLDIGKGFSPCRSLSNES